MSGFSAEWLALREPFDRRARNPKVLARVVARFAGLPSIAIVDLACGTGATRRAIAKHLPLPQRWRLVDNDLSLLARTDTAPALDGSTATSVPLDLAHDVEAALDGALDLVTTSSLLDLVSGEWLERLVTEVAARRLPLYAALSYDGRNEVSPAHPFDAALFAAFNRDQATDKGFGPALGPRAVEALQAICRKVGYDTMAGKSNWEIVPPARDMQLALIDGWTGAACRTGTVSEPDARDWQARCSALAQAGALTITVGHVDVFAWPASN